MTSMPTRLHITPKLRKVFDDACKLNKFYDQLAAKQFFFLALLLGHKNGTPLELGKKEGYVRAEYLNDTDTSLLQALAVSHKNDIKIISDMHAVYSIAEQYANGGTEHLKAMVLDDPASFTKKFAAFLRD